MLWQVRGSPLSPGEGPPPLDGRPGAKLDLAWACGGIASCTLPNCWETNTHLPATLIDAYNAAIPDLLAGAVGTARPSVEAVQFAELLLALNLRPRR
jgi:hypothetical protein